MLKEVPAMEVGAFFDTKSDFSVQRQGILVNELNDFFALSRPARGYWNPTILLARQRTDLHAAYLFTEWQTRPDSEMGTLHLIINMNNV